MRSASSGTMMSNIATPEQFRRTVPQHGLHPVADEGVATLQISFPDELAGDADDVVETAVAFAQVPLGLDALGQVVGHHGEAQQPAAPDSPDPDPRGSRRSSWCP